MLLYNSRARCRRCCLWPFCFLDLEHYSDPVRPAAITPRGVGYVVVSLFAWRRPAHRSCDIANDLRFEMVQGADAAETSAAQVLLAL